MATTPLSPSPRRGTMTYRGQTTQVKPFKSQFNPLYKGDGNLPSAPRAAGAAVGTAANPSPSAMPRTPVAPSPRPTYQSGQYAAGSFGDQNARANAGIYDAGTFGATNALANRTGVAAPRGAVFSGPSTGLPSPSPRPTPSPTSIGAVGTESANPLAGDGNSVESGADENVNAGVALGFSRRGMSTPRGQDSAPAGFRSPVAATAYNRFVRRIFGQV